jgi:hypothetical protein
MPVLLMKEVNELMDKTVNVKIPLPLLRQTIELLECWDVSASDTVFQHDFDNVYFALLKKRESLELRHAYAKIIYAKNEEARHAARMHYLAQKRFNDDF